MHSCIGVLVLFYHYIMCLYPDEIATLDLYEKECLLVFLLFSCNDCRSYSHSYSHSQGGAVSWEDALILSPHADSSPESHVDRKQWPQSSQIYRGTSKSSIRLQSSVGVSLISRRSSGTTGSVQKAASIPSGISVRQSLAC